MSFRWAIFSKAGLTTACRVMAKRLRDVCGLPESECSVVEQQSNEGTKLSGFVSWFLGCSKNFKMK